MKELMVKIDSIRSENYCQYSVWDDGQCISTGVSSNKYWVVHDAGGYHTKEEFDKLYPEGWKVKFDFEYLPPNPQP